MSNKDLPTMFRFTLYNNNNNKVGRESVPELGSRATEGSAPHSAEAGRGHREVDGGGGSKGTSGGGDVQEVRQGGRGEVVDGHECEQEEFVIDAVCYREPVEVLEDRGDVVVCGGLCDDAGGRVLDQLEFMEGLVGEAEEERIAIVQTGGDEAVDGGGVGGEGGAESVNVAEMEICIAGNGVDVRVEGKCAVEDDTQTLYLRGGGN